MSGATLKIEKARFVITVDPERRDGQWCDGTYGLPLFFSASFPS